MQGTLLKKISLGKRSKLEFVLDLVKKFRQEGKYTVIKYDKIYSWGFQQRQYNF